MAASHSQLRAQSLRHPFVVVYGDYMFRSRGLTLETLKQADTDQAAFGAYIPKLDGTGWYTLHDIQDPNIRIQLLDRALDKFPEAAQKIREEFPDDFEEA